MLRTGLRNDDVQALVREVRAARDEGLGPDEAWSRAKKTVTGVEPEVFDAWREHVEKQAEGGTAQVARQLTTTNVLARITEQDEEIARLKRKLSEAGARIEQLNELASQRDHFEQVASEKIALVNGKDDRIEQLNIDLAQTRGKYDALVADARAKLAMKDGEIEKLKGDLDAAEEMLKKPSKK